MTQVKRRRGLQNKLWQVKRRKGWRMSCDVGEAIQGLDNESISPALTSLHLRHSSFSNPSAALPTSQLILQPLRWFTYVVGTSRTSSGEPPMHTGMKKQSVVDQLVKASYYVQKKIQFWIVVKNFTTSSKHIFFGHIVSSDSSFNIHKALYFVKHPSRAVQNSPEGRRWPAGRGLKTPVLDLDNLHVLTSSEQRSSQSLHVAKSARKYQELHGGGTRYRVLSLFIFILE